MRAFLLVTELELAVEISVDYREISDLVAADEIETGIRRLMKEDDEARRKVTNTSKMGRMAVSENGSSFQAFTSLVVQLTTEAC